MKNKNLLIIGFTAIICLFLGAMYGSRYGLNLPFRNSAINSSAFGGDECTAAYGSGWFWSGENRGGYMVCVSWGGQKEKLYRPSDGSGDRIYQPEFIDQY